MKKILCVRAFALTCVALTLNVLYDLSGSMHLYPQTEQKETNGSDLIMKQPRCHPVITP